MSTFIPNHLLKVAEIYAKQLRRKENEDNKLNWELNVAKEALDNTRLLFMKHKIKLLSPNNLGKRRIKEGTIFSKK